MRRSPDLDVEREILGGGARVLAAVDEVGRGAAAGCCSVGVVLVAEPLGEVPPGLADSKLLGAARRDELVPLVRRWALGSAVGHASAGEVDALGINPALRLAGWRALGSLEVRPDVVLLDGSFDWLSGPEPSLFEGPHPDFVEVGEVRTLVRADMRCASVAAASVLAKVERDALMDAAAADHPGYGWETNRGYATAAHLRAIEAMGLTGLHRRSWHLSGLDVTAARGEPLGDGGGAGPGWSGPDRSPR